MIPSAPPVPLRPLRVLVIEDEPGDAELVRLQLLERRADAFEVCVVGSLGEARAYLEGCEVEPDVVLLDLNLPDSHGTASVERCRALVDAPIVVLTGLDDEAASRVAIDSGADDYLAKGGEGSELRRAVRYARMRHQRDADARLATEVFTHAREGILITDASGTIIDVNQTFSQITGYQRDEVIGANPRLLSSGLHPKGFFDAYWEALLTKGHWYGEIWNRRKNGENFAALQTVSAVRDRRGRTMHYVALFSDITVQKEHESALRHIAHYDMLTGLPNRVLFADRLQQAMSSVRRNGKQLAVAFIDLDGFKAVNDRFGHAIGDKLLVMISANMRNVLRESDTLARLGGDEFAAVIADIDGDEESTRLAARLLEGVARPLHYKGHDLHVSASIGLTHYPQVEEVAADQLLRQSDQAMYQAKQAGKGRFQVFDVALERDQRLQHHTIERIARGLAQDEFVLFYQPKVNLRTNAVIGAEALIRWQDPERGLLPPGAFLSDIENHPVEVQLGDWVLDRALRQMMAWQRGGLTLPVSVNISAQHLQSKGFAQILATRLAEYPGIDPASLELEILETSALADLLGASNVLDACTDLGVRLSFDDFGTGYSSLSYLKRLPASVIKIDQSFVRDILDDPSDLAIVKAVIGLAKGFDRQVIAEGVENSAIRDALLDHGCEFGQGYGIARPMPADEVPAWMAAWQREARWLS